MGILPWKPRKAPDAPPAPEVHGKFGLYPLGGDDVVMSLLLFEVVVRMLEKGTEEDRHALAEKLREGYDAHYV